VAPTVRRRRPQTHLGASVTRPTSDRHLPRRFRGEHPKGDRQIHATLQRPSPAEPVHVLVHRHRQRQLADLRAPPVEEFHPGHGRQRVSDESWQTHERNILTQHAADTVSSSYQTSAGTWLSCWKDRFLKISPTSGDGDREAMLSSRDALPRRRIWPICQAGNMQNHISRRRVYSVAVKAPDEPPSCLVI